MDFTKFAKLDKKKMDTLEATGGSRKKSLEFQGESLERAGGECINGLLPGEHVLCAQLASLLPATDVVLFIGRFGLHHHALGGFQRSFRWTVKGLRGDDCTILWFQVCPLWDAGALLVGKKGFEGGV